MYHVMKRTGFDKFTTVSQHLDKTEAIQASKREARRTNQVCFVMQELGESVPTTVVDYSES